MDALIQVGDLTKRDDGAAAVGILPMSRMPWLVRTSGGTTGWPAMEIYVADNLLDVVVATRLGAGILRGARRASWDGLPGAIAWGRLPADGTSIAVHFAQRRLRRWPGSRAQRTGPRRDSVHGPGQRGRRAILGGHGGRPVRLRRRGPPRHARPAPDRHRALTVTERPPSAHQPTG
jgi:hypothetical protein